MPSALSSGKEINDAQKEVNSMWLKANTVERSWTIKLVKDKLSMQ